MGFTKYSVFHDYIVRIRPNEHPVDAIGPSSYYIFDGPAPLEFQRRVNGRAEILLDPVYTSTKNTSDANRRSLDVMFNRLRGDRVASHMRDRCFLPYRVPVLENDYIFFSYGLNYMSNPDHKKVSLVFVSSDTDVIAAAMLLASFTQRTVNVLTHNLRFRFLFNGPQQRTRTPPFNAVMNAFIHDKLCFGDDYFLGLFPSLDPEIPAPPPYKGSEDENIIEIPPTDAPEQFAWLKTASTANPADLPALVPEVLTEAAEPPSTPFFWARGLRTGLRSTAVAGILRRLMPLKEHPHTLALQEMATKRPLVCLLRALTFVYVRFRTLAFMFTPEIAILDFENCGLGYIQADYYDVCVICDVGACRALERRVVQALGQPPAFKLNHDNVHGLVRAFSQEGLLALVNSQKPDSMTQFRLKDCRKVFYDDKETDAHVGDIVRGHFNSRALDFVEQTQDSARIRKYRR